MRRFLKRTILPIWIGLNVLIAAIMVFTGFAGCIDPDEMPFAGVAGMTFSGWWILNLLILVADLVFCRKLTLIPVLGIIICLEPFWTFCPLNLRHKEVSHADSARVFKILSYNVLSFQENRPEDVTAENGVNRTMHTILSSDADIVVIAEYNNMGPIEKNVSDSQIDSLNKAYPYHVIGLHGNALYAKKPIMHIEAPAQKFGSGSHEVYRTTIDGKGIMIFGVHMVSIGLNDTDKSLYREITDMQTDSVKVSSVRTQLIDKLYNAFKERNVQAMMIREYIDQLPGENVIVCGDFNDVPNCRAIRILEETGMKDAYSEVGFGPMFTYNDSRLLFRIDHVMYRGAFAPIRMIRGDVASSDHYPLLTTFMWNE